MNEKKSFVLYCNYRKHIKLLCDEEKARLLEAIFAYADGEDVELDGAAGMAFSFIKAQMDRDAMKWEEKRQSRSEAGKKGMASRWGNKDDDITKDNNVIPVITNDNKTLQDVTTITDNVNVNVNVNDNDINIIRPINYQEIVNLFNTICVSYPKVKRLSEARKKAIKARLRTYTVDDLKKAFQMAEESSFLKGETQAWAADFDWMLKDANLAKILDGNYNKHNKTSKIEINPSFRQFQEEQEVVHFNIN